jgi:hypothetical protein
MREGLARTGDLLTRRVALTSPGGSRGPTEGEPAGEPIEVTNVSCTTSQHLPFYIGYLFRYAPGHCSNLDHGRKSRLHMR